MPTPTPAFLMAALAATFGAVVTQDLAALKDELACPAGRSAAITPVMPGGRDRGPQDLEIWVYCEDPSAPLESQPGKGLPFEGTVLQWSPYGRLLLARAYYEGGRLEGPYVKRHWNGRLAMRGHFRHGRLDGRVERWHPNGQLSQDIGFLGGEFHGEWHSFDEDGSPTRVSNYAQGKKHGLQERYHPGGVLRSREYYANDVLDGSNQRWAPDGTLLAESIARDDHWEGVSLVYHLNGEIARRAVYLDGERLESQRADANGRWVPDNESDCQGQGGEWAVTPSCWGAGPPMCFLPDAETQSRCAASGSCDPACRLDEVEGVVCPAAARP